MSEERNINLVFKHDEDEEKPILTLRGLFKQIKRFFVLWIVLAIVAAIGASGYTYMTKSSNVSVQAMVEFTFSGAENGKDPAGNEFDVTKMKAPVVLDSALNSLGLKDEGIHVDHLRDNIKIKGVTPEDAFQELTAYKSIFESGGSTALSAVKAMLDVGYYPTRYIITLDLDSAGIEEDQGVAVMDAILTAYKQYFYETYGYNKALGSAVLAVDYTDYDYERVVEVYDSTLESAQKYVNTLASEDTTNFRSVNTGYSFADLSTALNTLRTEDLDWISSYITVNNVTKDKETLLTYYEYRIQALQRTQAAAETNLASIEASIAAYQKDTMLVVGSADGSNATVTQTSKQYDEMINRKLEVQAEISDCIKNITYYQYRVSSLQETSSVASKTQMETLDKKFDKLYEKITVLLDTINVTADEYFENVAYANAYSIVVPATVSSSSRSSNLITMIATAEAVLFILIALIIVCFALAEQYRLNTGVSQKAETAVDAVEETEETEKSAQTNTEKTVQKKGRK